MGLRTKLMTGILASGLSLGGAAALAQDAATPSDTGTADAVASPTTQAVDLEHITLMNPEGDTVAVASITQDGDKVTITITNDGDSGLEPGEHGVHIHEFGICDPSGPTPFESAGGHFNPTHKEHGDLDDDESHAGDLGNLMVEDDGSIDVEITTSKVMLEEGADTSLDTPQGTSLMIHAGMDDLESQPAGDSGDREACGIIFPFQDETMTATPAEPESDEATPAS